MCSLVREFPASQCPSCLPALLDSVDSALSDAKNAPRRQCHHDDQNNALPQKPVRWVLLSKQVLSEHEDRNANESSIKTARTAQDQHNQYITRQFKAQRIEGDKLSALSLQGTRKAGQRRRNHIDDKAPPHDRTADRHHTRVILANAAQRPAEGRVDHRPHKDKNKKQCNQSVEECGFAAEVELEKPKHRSEGNTL